MSNKKLNVIGHKCGYDEVRIYVSVMTTQNTYFKLYTEPTGYSIHILLKLFPVLYFIYDHSWYPNNKFKLKSSKPGLICPETIAPGYVLYKELKGRPNAIIFTPCH